MLEQWQKKQQMRKKKKKRIIGEKEHVYVHNCRERGRRP
jgi:hypothetical protein